MVCLHLPDSFVCAGGEGDRGFTSEVRRFKRDGSVAELASLPTAKGWFGLAFRRSFSQLITVGGTNGRELAEANSLMLNQRKWCALPELPTPMSDRCACVVEPDFLLAFGGNPFNSGRGVELFHFGRQPFQWRPLLSGTSPFEKRYGDFAAVIGTGERILVFGSKKARKLWEVSAEESSEEGPLKL